MTIYNLIRLSEAKSVAFVSSVVLLYAVFRLLYRMKMLDSYNHRSSLILKAIKVQVDKKNERMALIGLSHSIKIHFG